MHKASMRRRVSANVTRQRSKDSDLESAVRPGLEDCRSLPAESRSDNDASLISASQDERGGRSAIRRAAATEMSYGTAGDHPEIYRFLVSVFQAPTESEFQLGLEEPTYEPGDRILIRDPLGIAGHLLMSFREMRLGEQTVPVCLLRDFAVRSDCRHRGYGTALLRQAELQMRCEGVSLGVLTTRVPEFFGRQGWVVAGTDAYSVCSPRQLLPALREESNSVGSLIPAAPGAKPRVRLWRHIEQDILVRLYNESLQGAVNGALVRTESYWRWLINRRGQDLIYVVDGGGNESPGPDGVVGYAATVKGRILELVAQDEPAARMLLQRVAEDALEYDLPEVRLDAAPDHPLHEILIEAGGQQVTQPADHGFVHMARVLDPWEWLEQKQPVLDQRLRASGTSRPVELGLHIDDHKLCLVAGKRGLKLQSGRLGRSYLRGSEAAWLPVLLGQRSVAQQVEAGRLVASTRVAETLASHLFPAQPWHRPSWDIRPCQEP